MKLLWVLMSVAVVWVMVPSDGAALAIRQPAKVVSKRVAEWTRAKRADSADEMTEEQKNPVAAVDESLGRRRHARQASKPFSKKSLYRDLKRRSKRSEVSDEHMAALLVFMDTPEFERVVVRLMNKYGDRNDVDEALINVLLHATPEQLRDPNYASTIDEQVADLLKKDKDSDENSDSDKEDSDDDSDDSDWKDDNSDDDSDDSNWSDDDSDYSEWSDDDDNDQYVDDTNPAIFDSPQWKALMVLTATNAEVNDPDFINRWMSKRSGDDQAEEEEE